MDDDALEELVLQRARSYGTGPPEDEEERASLLADCARAVGADDSRFRRRMYQPHDPPLPHWREFPKCRLCAVWRRFSSVKALQISAPIAQCRPGLRESYNIKLSAKLTPKMSALGMANGLIPPTDLNVRGIKVPVRRILRDTCVGRLYEREDNYCSNSECCVIISTDTFFSEAHFDPKVEGDPFDCINDCNGLYKLTSCDKTWRRILQREDEPMLEKTLLDAQITEIEQDPFAAQPVPETYGGGKGRPRVGELPSWWPRRHSFP